eukprot:8081870-Pyramimonas_sp.AAC.1
MVVRSSARLAISAKGSSASSLKCPVRKVVELAIPRHVSGMPRLAPMPAAAVIPGTMCTRMPRARRNSISSPPRPNMF